jgi:peptidoglycan/LPS O-acetylase OafA/YrhL
MTSTTNSPVTQAGGKPHYGFLDALRGLAALAVVVVHTLQNFDAGPWNGVLSWGAAGVQLFYIVSAYSLCLSISQGRGPHGPFWRSYLTRRFFRIAPLFWLAIGLYLLRPLILPMDFAPVDVHPPFWTLQTWHVIASLLFINGWHYQSINFIVPGGWSVAIESNFYLLLPFVVWWANNTRRALITVALSLLLAVVCRMLLYYLFGRLHAEPPSTAFGIFAGLWLPAQLPVFMLGVLLYRLAPKLSLDAGVARSGRRMLAPLVLTALSLALVWLAPVSWQRLASEPFQWGLVLMGFSWMLAWWPTKWLVNPVSLFLGKISYSLYLLHMIGLHLVVWVSKQLFEPAWGHPPSFWLAFPVVTLVSALIAYAGYRWVEVPGQALGLRVFSK